MIKVSMDYEDVKINKRIKKEPQLLLRYFE